MATTASVSASSRFPTTEEIKSAMEIAGASVEGAEYLASQVRTFADKSKYLSKSPELRTNIIAAVDKYVDYVKLKFASNSQPWSGQQVETSELKNMQNNIAEVAAKELTGKVSDVQIDYAISEKGHYVRGYSSSEGQVEQETVSNLDRIFNAWLATKDFVSKAGFIYNANDSVQSEATRIDANVVQQLMASGGLAEFMAEKGVAVTLRERGYPGEEKEAAATQEATATAAEQSRAADVREEVEPQADAGVTGPQH